MKTLEELKETPRLCIKSISVNEEHDFFYGRGIVEWDGFRGTVVFGHNEGWLMDHVSISHYKPSKLPTWDDMCKLKDMFFHKDEMVVQIHPSEENYVHGVYAPLKGKLENVLHLWSPVNGDFSILNEPERCCLTFLPQTLCLW